MLPAHQRYSRACWQTAGAAKGSISEIQRVGHLWAGMTGAAHFREIETPARALGLQLKRLEMKEPGDLKNAFRIAAKDTDALIVVGAAWLNSHRTQIIDLAAKTRVPIMYTQRQFVVEGGLMSYSADYSNRPAVPLSTLIGF
jgi:ABC-type uncharacterized transport system substrate-binding protein